jgi:amino acid transporter
MSGATSTVLAYESQPHVTGFTRSLGLPAAIAVNMTQMCGIGPFLTIPLMVAAMGGPQAIFGWLIGAGLVMADGLVWAELGAAMPGAGGTYLYLREAFQYRTGRMMPFLFIWTAMVFIPLTMSVGVIGIVQYLGYYFPHLTRMESGAISVAICALIVFALYRKISAIARLTNLLFIVMLITVALLILACATHFQARLAFTFPQGAFHRGSPFWNGLGAGLIIAVFDYLGYNTTAYMGEEMRDPGRVIPRSIVYSILGIMAIYICLNVGVMGVLPWKQIAESTSIGSLVMEHVWGKHIAQAFTALIIITAFASLVTGLLGGSRVPYHAAKDRLFLPMFGRLHPRLNFPHVALLAMGVITAIGSFFPLDQVLQLLTAVMVLVQSIAQIVALTVLRHRQPHLPRPYRMFLYPLPSLIALAGWVYLYKSSGTKMMLLSLGWVALGALAFIFWAGFEKTWPFGPLDIREEFADA